MGCFFQICWVCAVDLARGSTSHFHLGIRLVTVGVFLFPFDQTDPSKDLLEGRWRLVGTGAWDVRALDQSLRFEKMSFGLPGRSKTVCIEDSVFKKCFPN